MLQATYKVEQLIAKGAFGSVVLLRPSWMNRLLAVKILVLEKDEAMDIEHVWLRAMRLQLVPYTIHSKGAVLLNRASVPVDLVPFLPLVEPGEKDDKNYLFIFMPYIEGKTLRQALGNTSYGIPENVIREWTRQIAEFSCSAYHHFGLTHNDLKLGNIMVDSFTSFICVIDFTFALRPRVDLNKVTWARGTFCYMPPEKLFFYGDGPPPYCQTPCDLASGDVWSIGTLMATMALAGKTVFMHRTPEEVNEARILSHDQRGFCPERTDSIYQLLPRSRPWLTRVIDEMVQRASYPTADAEQILQAVRLLLWTRALHFRRLDDAQRKTYLLPTDAYLPGIESSPLHSLLLRYTPRILKEYDEEGRYTFERARDCLASALGQDLFRVYLETQSWKPSARTRALHPNQNPFLHLLIALTGHDVPLLAPAPSLVCKDMDFQVWKRMDHFIQRFASNPCECCGGPSTLAYCPNCPFTGACNRGCESIVREGHVCKRT